MWLLIIIIVPAQRNISALNIAWVTKWKNVKRGRLKARLIIITPSWLKVDKAIIFFMSFSISAAILAMKMVKDETMSR